MFRAFMVDRKDSNSPASEVITRRYSSKESSEFFDHLINISHPGRPDTCQYVGAISACLRS
jgi:hypothetical protein